MIKELLIVFVKNIKLGKVKTRLAKTIGDDGAFQVYKRLVEMTESATSKLSMDKRIYFSDVVIEEKWPGFRKTIQSGNDLGEKMQHAFEDAFRDGYNRVILIGSDLPTISGDIVINAFECLNEKDVVLGPAEDGGYYLIGLSAPEFHVFKDKPWSEGTLLDITLKELEANNMTYNLLKELNDIDTYEDLLKSSLATEFKSLEIEEK